MIRLLLSLEGDRRIDVHARDEWAFRSISYFYNLQYALQTFSLLLTDSLDRLPSREVYGKHYKGPEPYDHWVWIHTGLPRRHAMVAFRRFHQSWDRRELCLQCCYSGSPIELERSLIGYRVEKTCTLEDLQMMREVAQEEENESCVTVLDRIISPL